LNTIKPVLWDSQVRLPDGTLMTGAPISFTENASYCRKQAERMAEQTREVWSKARYAVERMWVLCSDLQAQIEELARDDGFRRKYASNMLRWVLDSAIEAVSTDMGNIQVYDAQKASFLIRAHRGFDETFLRFFDSVPAGDAVRESAAKSAKPVIISEVANSPVFRSTTTLEVLLDAGVRSLQTTPLMGRSKAVLGMLSTYYRTVGAISKKNLRRIDYFASKAAAIIEWQNQAPAR